MDPEKVQALKEGLTLSTRKQVYYFLGFPCTHLPLSRLGSSGLRWPRMAFKGWKSFTCTPVLTIPGTHHQFVVEVDTLDVGVRAVLSQRNSQDSRLHSRAYLSRKLSQPEQNYEIGNREWLAVKVGWVASLAGGDHFWCGLAIKILSIFPQLNF